VKNESYLCVLGVLGVSKTSRCRELVLQQLLPVQLRVEPVLPDQMIVGAALGDASALEDENLIRMADRGNAV
jgi:hypothetical protein